jgi:hypothetical protein
MCIVLSDYRLNIAHAAITYFYCISVEDLMQLVVQWKVLVNKVKKITPYISADIHAKWWVEPNDITLPALFHPHTPTFRQKHI